MTRQDDDAKWLSQLDLLIDAFAADHAVVLENVTSRSVAASFEIGCLLLLEHYYRDKGYTVVPQNLINGHYRCLTSPSGNPSNFSFLLCTRKGRQVEIRQQIRVQSTIDTDIAFTPDLAVVRVGSAGKARFADEFARGKRRIFFVEAPDVIAAHECKCLVAFPELMVSFIGMLHCGHAWLEDLPTLVSDVGDDHLLPTLFIGGGATPWHRKMADAMQRKFPLNIALGVYGQNFRSNRLRSFGMFIKGDDWGDTDEVF